MYFEGKIDFLGSALSQCAFDHKRLKFLFQKKQAPHIHAHTLRHAHALGHAHKCAHVYSYSHYGRRGHLAKFYFDKLKVSNSNVWVRNDTNFRGPKKIYVPKSTPIVFDVSVSSLKM